MINSVKVTNPAGESTVLILRSPEKSGFFVRNIDGLGPSKATINMSESLSLDGGYFNSSRVSPKNLVFDLGFLNINNISIETIRQQSYRFFPLNQLVTFEIETDNRIGVISGYIESNEPNIFSREESTIISAVCPSAYFFGQSFISQMFKYIDSGFEFPWENPSLTLPLIEFGTVYDSTSVTINYKGDVAVGVFISASITGAVNNLTFANSSTGQTMALDSAKITAITGSNLIAGDSVQINTIKGNKYAFVVRGATYWNILNALPVNTDWIYLKKGPNTITYSAASGVANVIPMVTYKPLYEGL